MSQVTIGEDILGILIAVGLISVFCLVLGNSFSAYQEQRAAEERSQLLLTVSDFLRNGTFSRGGNETEPGLLNHTMLEERLPQFIERLGRESTEVRVKIVSLDHDLLFSWGKKKEELARSISVPVVYELKDEKVPARLIVRTGG